MSSLINKKIRANDVSLPKPHPQVSSRPLSDLEQRIKLISSELDEGNVKGGIRLAASYDKTAPSSTDNYQKLLSKHPQRAKFAVPNPEKLDSFFVTDFDLYKAIMSFPNGSAAGPDKIIPQTLKDLVSKSNGSAGLSFLKLLSKLINLIGDGKVPEPLRPFFFGAKLIALIKIDNKLLRNSLCKVTNVNMDDNQFLQAVLPAAKGDLGVSSARLLALPAFLASAVGAKDAKSLVCSMWMEPMMMRLNGGLNLEKLKWPRKMKSKKIGRSQFLTAKLQT